MAVVLIEVVLVVADAAERLNDVMSRGFLFHLLVDIPLEDVLRGVVLLVDGEGVEGVDETRYLFLVLQRMLVHSEG